jgi:hypothetical protein
MGQKKTLARKEANVFCCSCLILPGGLLTKRRRTGNSLHFSVQSCLKKLLYARCRECTVGTSTSLSVLPHFRNFHSSADWLIDWVVCYLTMEGRCLGIFKALYQVPILEPGTLRILTTLPHTVTPPSKTVSEQNCHSTLPPLPYQSFSDRKT